MTLRNFWLKETESIGPWITLGNGNNFFKCINAKLFFPKNEIDPHKSIAKNLNEFSYIEY